jgi:hypothetical protein
MSIDSFVEVIHQQALRRGVIRAIGVYADGHVHIDIRPSETLVMWRA